MTAWNIFSKVKKAVSASNKSNKPKPQKRDLIGEVEGYYRKVNAAVIKVKKGPVKVEDRVWIFGYTTDIKQTIESMEIDRKPIQSAKKGQSIGVRVKKRVRRGDKVYRVPE